MWCTRSVELCSPCDEGLLELLFCVVHSISILDLHNQDKVDSIHLDSFPSGYQNVLVGA